MDRDDVNDYYFYHGVLALIGVGLAFHWFPIFAVANAIGCAAVPAGAMVVWSLLCLLGSVLLFSWTVRRIWGGPSGRNPPDGTRGRHAHQAGYSAVELLFVLFAANALVLAVLMLLR